MDDESPSVIRRLERAIVADGFSWSPILVGEDATEMMATFIRYLRGPFSATGDGRRVDVGFSYWGVGPTIAWAHACNDPLYPVMKTGGDLFVRHWSKIHPVLGDVGYHCVSLGVGTGQKDRAILSDLMRADPRMFYFPIDMSIEMLKLGSEVPVSDLRFPRHRMLPIQADFSVTDNMQELGRLLHQIVDDDPILYTLTGNTLANFDDDLQALDTVARVLRPQDRLLIEVATTDSSDRDAAAAAAAEYAQTRAFAEFAMSALKYNTDLQFDQSALRFAGSVEDNGTLLIKVMFQNDTGRDLRMWLPDHTFETLPADDTIRLIISRKYPDQRLRQLAGACSLGVLETARSRFRQGRQASPFGLELMLLARRGRNRSEDRRANPPDVEDVWPR